MKYEYKDFPDKTKEGLDNELTKGLAVMAVFFQQTHGIPLEIFNNWLEEKCPNRAYSWKLYMNFRNLHPKLYASTTANTN